MSAKKRIKATKALLSPGYILTPMLFVVCCLLFVVVVVVIVVVVLAGWWIEVTDWVDIFFSRDYSLDALHMSRLRASEAEDSEVALAAERYSYILTLLRAVKYLDGYDLLEELERVSAGLRALGMLSWINWLTRTV